MKSDKPILFTPKNIKKIRADEKWQTRRVVKNPYLPGIHTSDLVIPDPALCPYGRAGSKLWVRETLKRGDDGVWRYALDNEIVQVNPTDETAMIVWAHHKETSVQSAPFMHRWAARLWLNVLSIRVERLQDISEEDAQAEGCVAQKGVLWRPLGSKEPAQQITNRKEYEGLWDSINGKTYPWESNPWVWVIEFKRAE